MASFGRISIEVRKGSELVAMNPGKTANPFVRISAGKNSFDTEVVEKTVNPSFEKGKHVFPPCPLPTILTINVFNKLIYLEEDEPMGTATVTIFSAGPETTKTVFLTHGGNVKLAAKARGGCGTLELVYTVTPCDSLDDEPPATAAAANSISAPPAGATSAMNMSSSVPGFLKDGGGGAPAATKPATDDPFEDMFGEKKKPDEIPTPPVVSTPTQPEPTPTPTQPVVDAAPVVTTPTPDAPPVSQYTSPPTAPETPPTQTTTTTNVMPDSLPSTPVAATPEPRGPLGQPVQTTTTSSVTAAAVPPPATTQSASSSIIATPTSANGDTKQFTPPPPLPAEPAPVSAVNTTKQVTFDGKSLKNLAINKRRSPSAGGTRTATNATTAPAAKSTATVRSSSASRNATSARGPSTTSARKTTSTTGPSATSALHNSHTAASSSRVNPISAGAVVAASASAHHHNGGPITSAQQLQHTNPHVAFLYTGDNAKSLLAAAISGSQKEFAQVKELDPLLMNGFLAVKDYSGRNALHLAAWHGNPAVIDQLINGRNPSGVAPRIDTAAMTTTSGNTLLHCAALGGDPRTVEWLLFQPSCQSLISMPNKRGLTPYQAALEAGNTDCAAAIQTVTSRGGGVGPAM